MTCTSPRDGTEFRRHVMCAVLALLATAIPLSRVWADAHAPDVDMLMVSPIGSRRGNTIRADTWLDWLGMRAGCCSPSGWRNLTRQVTPVLYRGQLAIVATSDTRA